MALRIILSTGGTGGHIFPALAVAEALRKKRPDAEILFIGGLYGPEKELAEKAGVAFTGLPVRGFIGRGLKAFSALAAMSTSIGQAMNIIKEFKPHAVMGFGGYASFAAVFAGRLLRCPCAVHEQNAVPGSANRLLGKIAKKICLSWPQPEDNAGFSAERCVLTGNPIRADIAAVGEHSKGSNPLLLIMGGSLGAHAINELAAGMYPELKAAGIRLLHQTGKNEYEAVRKAYLEKGCTEEEADAIVHPFLYDMADAYRNCTLALCRAGATTLAELAATGTPALLLPFPYAAHNHQTANAQAMQNVGGAVLIPQDKALQMAAEGSFAPLILELMKDASRLEQMRLGALSLACPEAADTAADELLSLTLNDHA